ncbi:MAG: hypothetical protein M1820_002305 [Bogoriella megaspora]|nr:MAG: hypothetical protein M1820_002305 [Bogoriella megaspora]
MTPDQNDDDAFYASTRAQLERKQARVATIESTLRALQLEADELVNRIAEETDMKRKVEKEVKALQRFLRSTTQDSGQGVPVNGEPPDIPVATPIIENGKSENKKQDNGKGVICHRCQQAGHIASNCTSVIEDRACRNCGEVGHLKKDCPNLSAKASDTKAGGSKAPAKSKHKAKESKANVGLPVDWTDDGPVEGVGKKKSKKGKKEKEGGGGQEGRDSVEGGAPTKLEDWADDVENGNGDGVGVW